MWRRAGNGLRAWSVLDVATRADHRPKTRIPKEEPFYEFGFSDDWRLVYVQVVKGRVNVDVDVVCNLATLCCALPFKVEYSVITRHVKIMLR